MKTLPGRKEIDSINFLQLSAAFMSHISNLKPTIKAYRKTGVDFTIFAAWNY